jgi:hypothetical protein
VLLVAFPGSVEVEDRFLMTLSSSQTLPGYFDESGVHDGSPVVVVAGWLATPDMWIAFERKWKDALTDFHIESFHTADCEAGVDVYKDWPGDVRQSRLRQLMGIITDHTIASFGASIPKKLFGDLVSPEVSAAIGGPYGLASWKILLDAGSFVTRTTTRPWIRYVFEQGAVGRHQFQRVYDENEGDAESRERLRLGALSFERKTEFVPLQAADVLAYQLYRAGRVDLDIDTHPRTDSLDPLRAKPNWWWRVHEAELRQWAEGLTDSPLMDALPPNPRRRRHRAARKARR